MEESMRATTADDNVFDFDALLHPDTAGLKALVVIGEILDAYASWTVALRRPKERQLDAMV